MSVSMLKIETLRLAVATAGVGDLPKLTISAPRDCELAMQAYLTVNVFPPQDHPSEYLHQLEPLCGSEILS